jgi:hypothetical protein
MKSISLLIATCWILAACFLVGCNKEKLNNAVANSGPSNNYGTSLATYQVSLKRVNSYPAGATILIEKFGYAGADSTKISSNVMLDINLPAKDTAFVQMEIRNYTMYLKWKILSANKDSLSGGTTTRLTTASSPVTFEIKY